jgi:esterase/lipase
MKIDDLVRTVGEHDMLWRLFRPVGAGREYCVLWLQGWSSSMESHREGVERMAKATKMTFATLDPSGHGTHKLPLDESNRRQQLNEVVAVYDELKNFGYKNIIVIGGSFGGYLAALLTGVRDVHTAVLRAPAVYADDELDTVHKQTRKWKNPDRDQQDKANDPYIKDNEAVRSIANFDGFTYVLEHELDEQVPRIMPMTYFENAKRGNYIIIPNTPHSPKAMKNKEVHFAYIEHIVTSIIEAVRLQGKL